MLRQRQNRASAHFFIFLLFLWALPLKAHAQEPEGMGDFVFAGTIKTLAKTYVQTADLEALKRKHIHSLLRMREDKFQKRYASIYDFLQDTPLELRERYGLKKQMTKQEAVQSIEHLDKKDVLEIIDEIPDPTITEYVKNYLSQSLQDQNQSMRQQLDGLWKKIFQKA